MGDYEPTENRDWHDHDCEYDPAFFFRNRILPQNNSTTVLPLPLPLPFIFLDEQLSLRDEIPYDAGWIQDCTQLQDGRILLNDVDNHQTVEFSPGPLWEAGRIVKYEDEWRMCEPVAVPMAHTQGFFSTEPEC